MLHYTVIYLLKSKLGVVHASIAWAQLKELYPFTSCIPEGAAIMRVFINEE